MPIKELIARLSLVRILSVIIVLEKVERRIHVKPVEVPDKFENAYRQFLGLWNRLDRVIHANEVEKKS
jgi:hypothetical protein